MSITNQSKPTTSLTNPTKVVSYETWDSNLTTWDTETRTWDEMGTTMSNTDKQFMGLTCYLKLDESSGDAIDYVNGEVFTDTYSNVTRVAGKIGNSAVFADGTTTQLVSNNTINLKIIDSFSVSFWIYPTASSGVRIFICNQPSTTNFHIGIQALRILFRVYHSAGNTFLQSLPGSTPINTWSHVICTYNANVGLKIYVGGTLNTSITFATIFNYVPEVISLGKITLGSTSSYTGQLDDVGFFNVDLNDEQAIYLYNSSVGIQPPFSLHYSNITNIAKPA
jgi:hypothetical protein